MLCVNDEMIVIIHQRVEVIYFKATGKIHPPEFWLQEKAFRFHRFSDVWGKKRNCTDPSKSTEKRAMCLPLALLDYAASEGRNIMYHKSLMHLAQV